MLSRSRGNKNSDCRGDEGIVTKKKKVKENMVFKVEGVPLNYYQKLRNTMTRKFRRNAHHIKISGEAAHF